MMIGVCDSARTLRHRLRPSSPGSMTSRIRRSTRWSVMSRAISRPSFAVVTLQELVRRYFAISVRVSRSSSTTRMFGVVMAMRTFVGDSGKLAKEFCFGMFLALRLQHRATQRNTPARQQKGLVKSINRRVGVSCKSFQDPFKIPPIFLGVIMTSISATSGTSYQSPLQKLQAELQSEVNSGAISSSDQSALSSALNDIDSSLQSGQASASSGSANASPGDLKSKIDSLIANEVSSGNLTSDQATELQDVFKQAFSQGDGGTSAPGGADGASGTGSSGRAHHHRRPC